MELQHSEYGLDIMDLQQSVNSVCRYRKSPKVSVRTILETMFRDRSAVCLFLPHVCLALVGIHDTGLSAGCSTPRLLSVIDPTRSDS